MLQLIHDITPAIKLTPYYRHHGTIFKCFIIEYRESRYYLVCELNDVVHAFVFGIGIYVLNINRSSGRIGFNSYMSKEHCPINSVYLHSINDVVRVLGAAWETMEPVGIALVLLGYLY